jgi:formylglycine-generating enzyme required for sulfatase activity
MWMNKDNGKHVTWVEAQDFCRASRIGGYSDWRLPTVEELKKIYEGKREFDEKPGIYHHQERHFPLGYNRLEQHSGRGF